MEELMKIAEEYMDACNMSCKPDKSFKWAKMGEIIDEEKSVRWNREEVERLRNVYNEEAKRLNIQMNKKKEKAIAKTIDYISKEANLSKKKATILWNFVYERYHAYGEMFQHIDEYIELARQLTKRGKD